MLGGPDVLRVVEADVPVPGPTEILVETRAIGVNPADWKTRASGGRLGAPPFTLGWEVAGVALNDEDARAVVDVEGVPMLVEPDRAGLDVLPGHALEGEIRVLVDRVFPLAEAAAAHESGESGHTSGKLVLRP